MELRQLRYFVDIAKTEHPPTSARTLFGTQSTLAHGLRQLEEELGMVLFERIGRGLKLSQAGVVFRNYAERALHEIEAGRMALADLSELQTGALTLGVIPTFLNTLVAPAVAAFTRAYPKVNVVVRELLAPPVEAGLLDGSLDLGVSFHPPQRTELEALPLFDERMMLLVNPSHALAGRRTLAVKSLADVPLALLPRSFYTRGLIDNGLRDAGVTPSLRVEMGSVESLIALCRWGDMATIVPERAAQQASDMVAIHLVGPQLVRTAGLLWRRGSHYSAAAREFAALLAPAARASLGREA
jgi:LysR family cyn operon transcriptional activator